MIASLIALVLLLGSFGIAAVAIISNQLHPGYESALGVSYALLIAAGPAFVGLAVAVLALIRNPDLLLAKRTMFFAAAYFVVLAILIFGADGGFLVRFS